MSTAPLLARRGARGSGGEVYAFLLLALLTAFVLACSKGEPAPTPTPPPTGAPPTATSVPTATPAPTLPPPAAIVWVPCESYQCAEFQVPIDYADPARGDFTLALIRLPARNQTTKIGSLLVNPGGPGGSGVDFLRSWSFAVPSPIRERFDIVSFDPRGVGLSSPIDCAANVQDILALDPDPTTDQEWQGVVDETQEFTDSCEKAAGSAIDFYGTENVARDMDRIRQGLGEDKLNYLGYSYGTSIGQVYADLFPQNVRAMVLDGALDNALDADQRNLEQIQAFEAALNRFMQYCRDTDCFDTDPADAIRTLIDRAEASPIPARTADRPLREGEVLWGLISSLYARFQWGGLANAISDALDGDGSRMLRLVDDLWGRNPDGSYDNFFDANLAVNCIDQVVDRNPDHHRRLSADFAKQLPFFGSWGGYLNLPCALWDAKTSPLKAPRAAGAPPILVIGNTGDPATPLKWATTLSQQLESAVLLTNDAEGHTAYLQGDLCVERAVNAYLLDLTVPAEGAHCGNAGIQPVPPLP
jgi:pimeloyl-ACP methyl ester carboxylesterase